MSQKTSSRFYASTFYTRAFNGIVFTDGVQWAGGSKVVRSLRCKKLIHGRDIGWGMCATSWCHLDLTFDLAIVTSCLKILMGIYLRNYKLQKIDICKGF